MGWTRNVAFALIGGILALPIAGHPQEVTPEERIEDLERRQREVTEELQRLREELRQSKETERRQGILTDEVRRLKESLVLPETKELKGHYGLGPAASKVYSLERGLSIGGYGETNLRKVVSDKTGTRDEFDFIRFVLYVGYKFNDWIVLNSETELEHAFSKSTVSSDAGEVALEFATLDFLLHPMANARFGLLLVPFGFLNEIHEPPFYHGNVRPPVESEIIPTTWRANGFGLFGELAEGLQYRTYGITSLNAEGFRARNLRDSRQRGNREIAEDFSWVGRADYTVFPGVQIGGSAVLGDTGQNEEFAGQRPDVFTQMYEGHAQVRAHGFEGRALGVMVDIDDADVLSEALSSDPATAQTVGERLVGYYFEGAYDVLPLVDPETTHYLAPWVRYSLIDTHDSVPGGFAADPSTDRDVVEFGLSYKPIPQVVLKADYRLQDSDGAEQPDEFRLGGGFVF